MAVSRRNIKWFVAILFVMMMIFLQPMMVWKLKQSLREVKWAMKIELLKKSNSDLHQVFYFTEREWSALPHPDPHEFVLNDVFYDVFHKEFQNGKWMVKCVRDDKEGEIKKNLKTWMAEEDSPYQKKKEQTNVFSVTKKMICANAPSFSIESVLNRKNINYFLSRKVLEPYCGECFQPPC